MPEKEISPLRKLVFSLVIVFVLLLLVAAVGETVMRLTQSKPNKPYDNKEKDSYLGWKPKAGYRFNTAQFPAKDGSHYPVDIQFGREGFRQWNSVVQDTMTRPTMFFIGDSYTEILECGNRETYYAYFQDSFLTPVYAYGCAGYGTAQEYLVLKKYIDTVKPDVVVVQTCSNDYIDNYWEMEMYSGYKVGETRPYLTTAGEIIYRYPRPWYEQLKEYSLFLSFVFERSHNTLAKLKLVKQHPSTQEMMQKEGKGYAPYKMSCAMTERALVEMNMLCKERNIFFYIFVLGNLRQVNSEMDDIAQMCDRNNIPIITGAIEKVDSIESRGVNLRSFDGYHFNPAGQKVLSQTLVDYFDRRFFK